MKQAVIEAVQEAARKDARLFFEEYQSPLDPSKTDWDGVSWCESSSVVKEIEQDADDSEYWETYQSELVKETERLADEYDRHFHIEKENWSAKVIDYHEVEICNTSVRFPILRLTAIDLSDEEQGIIDEVVDQSTVLEVIQASAPDYQGLPLTAEFGEWNAAEYPYVYCKVTICLLQGDDQCPIK